MCALQADAVLARLPEVSIHLIRRLNPYIPIHTLGLEGYGWGGDGFFIRSITSRLVSVLNKSTAPARNLVFFRAFR